MFGTKALLQAHIDECGNRYRRLEEQQIRHHSENQGAITAIANSLEALRQQLSGSQIDVARRGQQQAISWAKWVIGGLLAFMLVLLNVVAWLVVNGPPWKH